MFTITSHKKPGHTGRPRAVLSEPAGKQQSSIPGNASRDGVGEPQKH